MPREAKIAKRENLKGLVSKPKLRTLGSSSSNVGDIIVNPVKRGRGRPKKAIPAITPETVTAEAFVQTPATNLFFKSIASADIVAHVIESDYSCVSVPAGAETDRTKGLPPNSNQGSSPQTTLSFSDSSAFSPPVKESKGSWLSRLW